METEIIEEKARLEREAAREEREAAARILADQQSRAEEERKALEAKLAAQVTCPKCGHKFTPGETP